MSTRQNGEIDATAVKVEAHSTADLGHPLMDAVHFDEGKAEVAKQFMSEDLPYYQERIASLMGRPEAADFFAWMKEQAKHEDNVLFKVLCPAD